MNLLHHKMYNNIKLNCGTKQWQIGISGQFLVIDKIFYVLKKCGKEKEYGK